jgi:outer membrane protein OmpU
MKHVLLATTALAMTASFAAADVSLSGKAQAGTKTTTASGVTSSQSVAGIDVNISASVTTDSGITLTVADDIGGGDMLDWNDDYAVDDQGTAIGQPTVTLSMSGTTITVDPNEVDDVYDDTQHGDYKISTTLAGFSIAYVGSTTGETASVAGSTVRKSNSYSLGYTMGDLSFSVAGTSNGDAGDTSAAAGFQAAEGDAMKWSASYKMGDMTLGMTMNNNGANDDITSASIGYNMGNGLSLSLSADDNDDWDASVTWSAGGVSVTYNTDEESAWDAYATYALGGGASIFASTAKASDWSAIGVEFTF